ncbi:50S ribosomal protein L18 [Desulfotomaculum copahuensis]|uniref:Large ribosomal subunit protein uL18 n=1 Tax=Desulfotomaculum copahuensis TaxID=1838280 RepID=A0A1B7LDJ6_9FIRM|nr:50S ribosomal protein L18 [Desulfotomaculum copahuensis]OAT81160.1 50S ribosomal protein L18 [Desulfotomaculum copahuensis]
MITKPDRKKIRAKRQLRIRNKIAGSAGRPRLNVFRSLQHIYAQLIDDQHGTTLASASTLSPELKGQFNGNSNRAAAAAVGKLLAQKAQEKGIKAVVFDRAGYVYHGRVKALAEAAREGGLEF